LDAKTQLRESIIYGPQDLLVEPRCSVCLLATWNIASSSESESCGSNSSLLRSSDVIERLHWWMLKIRCTKKRSPIM